MKKNLAAVCLLFLPLCSIAGQSDDAILSEVAVLTIHVRDTNIHAGVFEFLTEVLKLPVDYPPVSAGPRRYAAVYAGNMFIEPCGPYTDMQYPATDFKALFFGLNCVSAKSPTVIAAHLDRMNIAYEKAGSKMFRIRDAAIAGGIYLGVDSHFADNSVGEKEASLGSALMANHRDGLGFEFVKEIWLGCPQESDAQAWSKVLGSSGRAGDTLWNLNKNQSIRFVRSEIKGVRAIVCKVRSLEKAETYLKQATSYGRLVDGKIELDTAKTFGLLIYLAE